jgi:hypothetical protein
MKRSRVVVLGALAALGALASASLTGCAGDEPDHAQVCYDEQTRRRVADERCDDSTNRGARWFYVPRGVTTVPPVGSELDTSRGSFTRPTSGSVRTVSRGGFGGRGGAGS